MIKLQTKEDFHRHLIPGKRFHVIEGGSVRHYDFACWHPDTAFQMNEKYFVAINQDNVCNSTVFKIPEIPHPKVVFITGEYVSKEIGEIMIAQLQKEIDVITVEQLEKRIATIRKIYCKESEQ